MLNRQKETKTRQVKPAQTGRRNHHNVSAWLRKWSQLSQWLEDQGGTRTQAGKTYALVKSKTTRKVRVAHRHKHANICADQKCDNPKSQGKEEAP